MLRNRLAATAALLPFVVGAAAGVATRNDVRAAHNATALRNEQIRRAARRLPSAQEAEALRGNIINARVDDSTPSRLAATVTRWRTLFQRLEVLRRADVEELRRRHEEAVHALAEADSDDVTAIVDERTAGSVDASAAQKELEGIDMLIAKQERLVLSRMQRTLLRDRVLRCLRSRAFAITACRMLRADAAGAPDSRIAAQRFIGVLNDIAFFEAVRARFVSSCRHDADRAQPRGSFQVRMARPVLPPATRGQLAAALSTALLPAAGSPSLPLSAKEAAALLLLLDKLQVPLSEEVVATRLVRRIVDRIEELDIRALITMLIWAGSDGGQRKLSLAPAATAPKQPSVSSNEGMAVALALSHRASEYCRLAPPASLNGVDAVHALLALTRLGHLIARCVDERGQRLPESLRATAKMPASARAEVLTAMLSRIVPTVSRPLTAIESNVKVIHRNALDARVREVLRARREAESDTEHHIRRPGAAKQAIARLEQKNKELTGQHLHRERLHRHAEIVRLQGAVFGRLSTAALLELAVVCAGADAGTAAPPALAAVARSYVARTVLGFCFRGLAQPAHAAAMPLESTARTLSLAARVILDGGHARGADSSDDVEEAATALADAAFAHLDEITAQLHHDSQHAPRVRGVAPTHLNSIAQVLTVAGALAAEGFFGGQMQQVRRAQSTVFTLHGGVVKTVRHANSNPASFKTAALRPIVQRCIELMATVPEEQLPRHDAAASEADMKRLAAEGLRSLGFELPLTERLLLGCQSPTHTPHAKTKGVSKAMRRFAGVL
jgi:hypothetical protein